jgi:hypothetical protein
MPGSSAAHYNAAALSTGAHVQEQEQKTRRRTLRPAEVTALRGELLEFLRRRPGATFAEIAREVPGFGGQVAMGTAYPNVILWRGISETAVTVLAQLEKERRIRFELTTAHPYGQDGRDVGLPIAMSLKDYDTPHWLPVLVHGSR